MFKLKILVLAVALFIAYLPASFVAWNLNPAYWSDVLRLLFILGVAVLFILIYGGTKSELLDRAIAEHKKNNPQPGRKVGGFQAMLQEQLDKAEQARREQGQQNN